MNQKPSRPMRQPAQRQGWNPSSRLPQSGRHRPQQGGHAWGRHERYLALAREAAARGDTVEAENLYQHAEHFFRVSRGQP